MAYQESYTDDENKTKDPSGQSLTSSETVVNPGASSTSSTPSAGASPAQANSGSGWTNLSNYVDANKQQASDMADSVVGGIDTGAKQNTANESAFGSDLGNQIQQGTAKAQGLNQNPINDVNAWTDNYKKATAGYQGPTDITTDSRFGDINNSVAKTGQQVQALNSNAGRAQTAQDTFGKLDNNYTQGENTLDSFLLGSGDAGKKLQDYSTSYNASNPAGAWSNLMTSLGGQIDQGKAASDQAKTAANSQLATQYGALNKSVGAANSALTATNSAQDKAYSDLYSKLQAAQQTGANPFETLGINPETAKQLASSGVDLTSLINKNTNQSLGDVVDPKTAMAYKALAELSGNSNPYNLATSGNTNAGATINQTALNGALAKGGAAQAAETAKKAAAYQAALKANTPVIIPKATLPQQPAKLVPAPKTPPPLVSAPPNTTTSYDQNGNVQVDSSTAPSSDASKGSLDPNIKKLGANSVSKGWSKAIRGL